MLQPTIYRNAKGEYFTKKDPNSSLDYSFDFSSFLTDAEDTIASANFIEIGCDISPLQVTESIASVLVSGGTIGESASVTCRITTVGARVLDKTLNFLIVEQ